tara:strand:- start:163 stop:450 length:288 start_codon:yes stop_codon:yes gene_type:complete
MAKKATYASAINSINPDAKITISGSDVNDLSNYDNIEWLEDTTPIAKDVLDAKVIELQTEFDNEEQSKIDLKASAKAKLVAGEALTQEEADTIVL